MEGIHNRKQKSPKEDTDHQEDNHSDDVDVPKKSAKNGSSSRGSKGCKNDKRRLVSSSTSNRAKRLNQKIKMMIGLIGFLILSFIIIVGIICPISFWSSPFIQRNILFMNWLNLPFKNLSNPEMEYDMNCTRNLYIQSTDPSGDNIKLGVWHVLPLNRISECDLDDVNRLDPKAAFTDSNLIVYYLHGNGGARGGNHRRSLYRVLAYNLNYHLVAIDYRGYGDSENLSPTVDGLIRDATAGYEWLLSQANHDSKRIIVWGHSLGTSIATYLVSNLPKDQKPLGLVLESPFNTLKDVVREHPFATPFKIFPHFDYFFVDPMVNSRDTNLDSESRIGDVTCPLIIMHALDDVIIPYHLGHRLYERAVERRPKGLKPDVQMITFNADLKYGHKNIFKDPGLPEIISSFVQSALMSRETIVTPESAKRVNSSSSSTV